MVESNSPKPGSAGHVKYMIVVYCQFVVLVFYGDRRGVSVGRRLLDVFSHYGLGWGAGASRAVPSQVHATNLCLFDQLPSRRRPRYGSDGQ